MAEATIAATELTPAEIRRYSRHLIMPEVGMAGQLALKRARVLIIGAGGLGSPAGLYLAAAGVGTIGIVEFDRVEESNLHRQVLFDESDVGRPKAVAAADRLRKQNPHIEVVPHSTMLTRENALRLFADYDIIVDATDNFPTRYLINDACVMLGKPNVYGSIFRFEGQVSVFHAGKGPCYRCLYPEPPPPGMVPSCAEGGVLGVLPGIVGSLQASEVIRLILGVGKPLVGRLLTFDALNATTRCLEIRADEECAMCSSTANPTELADFDAFCGLPERSIYDEAVLQNVPELSVGDLHAAFSREEPLVLLDVRTPPEWAIAQLPHARTMPLEDLEGRLDELDPSMRIVCFCQTGVRSAMAARTLRDAGFSDVASLHGGIDAWSVEIDPSLPRY
jgi:molybdopterin/thiamine biosynthesis adenylyltransferase/rhodanese-related sulfurtransferase